MNVRLQKYLAEAGLGSRRSCEDLIRAGRVTVDGKVAHIGDSVNGDAQVVAVDERLVTKEQKEYWLLNKPIGILSAAVDTRGRPVVTDLVPTRVRVFPVGRLDLDSTGLLVLTNDGELAARLLHPRYHVEKEYLVVVRGIVAEAALRALRHGVVLDDGPAAPARVDIVNISRRDGSGATTALKITIHEGRKRQVRRMMEAVGHRVVTLHRSGFAGLSDEGLVVGRARRLSAEEIQRLKNQAFES